MSTFATTVGITAFAELVKLISKSAFEKASGNVKNSISQWIAEENIKKLASNISDVGMVKTIWQIDKAVPVKSFYSDTHISFRDEDDVYEDEDVNVQRIKIGCVNDFNIHFKGNVLIQGVAGQGKSIFLRYLCITELLRAKYLPIFIELRHITSGETLMGRILQECKNYGLSLNRELFEAIAQSGKVLLLLDAFDEVAEEEKHKVIVELEDMCRSFKNMRIIVTSRPYNDVANCATFRNVTIDYLKNDEYKIVIRKLIASDDGHKDDSFEKELLRAIEENQRILGFINTPLLVTMLVVTYKAYRDVPSQMEEFYESLFSLFLKRHDGTKPGMRRPRKCTLNDIQYRRAFDAMCFYSKQIIRKPLNQPVMYALSQKALDKSELQADPENLLDDIIKITCLILREGDEYRFIHKSIQEYYAASYIKDRPDSVKAKFYNDIIGRANEWLGELLFLEKLDCHCFGKHFALPSLMRALNITHENIRDQNYTTTKGNIYKFWSDIEVGLNIETATVVLECIGGFTKLGDFVFRKISPLLWGHLLRLTNELALYEDGETVLVSNKLGQVIFETKEEDSMIDIKIVHFLNAGMFIDEATLIYDKLLQEAREIDTRLQKEESVQMLEL